MKKPIKIDTEEKPIKHVKNLSKEDMRNYILNAHSMALANMVQTDTEMRKRIGALLERAVSEDDIMSGFLGRPTGDSSRDIMGEDRGLADEPVKWDDEELRKESKEKYGEIKALTKKDKE